MPESKSKQQFTDPTAGPVLSARFIVALLLMAGGVAWILYYYIVVRVDPAALPDAAGQLPTPGGPNLIGDLGEWNYLIGFGLFFLGLMASAHPKTPLGRGRGVVVGMLGSFVLGLLWICTFYVISDDVSALPIFNDLGQQNLMVGIAFMAVGFTFATRWE